MPTDVQDLLKTLPASRRRKIAKRAAELRDEYMTLQQLRRARKLTQVKMAKSLGVAQNQISAIEKRTDMHISTLRRTVEAMGGKLEIVAQFPDRAPVHIAGISAAD
jgi:DNA-binding XRE family transcriptional regulator